MIVIAELDGKKVVSGEKDKISNISITNWRESLFLEVLEKKTAELEEMKIRVTV